MTTNNMNGKAALGYGAFGLLIVSLVYCLIYAIDFETKPRLNHCTWTIAHGGPLGQMEHHEADLTDVQVDQLFKTQPTQEAMLVSAECK